MGAQRRYEEQVEREQQRIEQQEEAWTWRAGCELLVGIIAVAWIAAQIVTRVF